MLNQFVLILEFQVRLGGKANEVLVGPGGEGGEVGVPGVIAVHSGQRQNQLGSTTYH